MATTDIAIVSRGLALIGSDPISSFADGTSKAATCEQIYEAVKQEALSAYPWRFTFKAVGLARLSDAPEITYTYAYQLPSDMLQGPREVYESDDENAPPITDYEIVGQQLHTNRATIYISYQQNISEGSWPAHFVGFVTMAFAAWVAPQLTDNATLSGIWWERAYGTPGENGMGGEFRKARNMDAQTRPPAKIKADRLIAARFR